MLIIIHETVPVVGAGHWTSRSFFPGLIVSAVSCTFLCVEILQTWRRCVSVQQHDAKLIFLTYLNDVYTLHKPSPQVLQLKILGVVFVLFRFFVRVSRITVVGSSMRVDSLMVWWPFNSIKFYLYGAFTNGLFHKAASRKYRNCGYKLYTL